MEAEKITLRVLGLLPLGLAPCEIDVCFKPLLENWEQRKAICVWKQLPGVFRPFETIISCNGHYWVFLSLFGEFGLSRPQI